MLTPATLDPADVRASVSALLGRDAGIVRWDSENVEHHLVHSTTAWLARLRGHAGDDTAWSLVVKATRRGETTGDNLWTSSADPAHRNYWKREYLAFDAGLLGSLPGRLRAPRCLLTTSPSDEQGYIWMEDVDGVSGRRWSDDHYQYGAFDLGTTQGAFISGLPLPVEPWLSRGWLRSWVADTAAAWDETRDDDVLWADDRLAPLVALRPEIDELRASTDALLTIVEAAPQTIIHGDFWPPNLYHGPHGETVAVDWSSVGIGSIGHDLDQLTLDPIWMQLRDPEDLAALESRVLPAYAHGLRDAGADVGDAELRSWYGAAAAAHFGLNAGVIARALMHPERIQAQEQRWDRPYAVIVARRAVVIAHALRLGEHALGAAGG